MTVLASIASLSQCLLCCIAALVGIGFVIGFHELGHFLFCKLFKVHTPSFSIGFGPRLFTKKMWDTEFALSAIPLGGYVEIAGASEVGQGEQQHAQSVAQDSFARKPWYQKFIIMIGGIFFNIVFAYITFVVLFMIGMPKSIILYPSNAINEIAIVRPNSASAHAGVAVGDVIAKIDDIPVTSGSMTIDILSQSSGKRVNLTVERNNTMLTFPVVIGQNNFLGINSSEFLLKTQPFAGMSIPKALCNGIALAHRQFYVTILGFKRIFAKGDTSMIGGPIALIAQTAKGAEDGLKAFLLFLASISINLAILNLLPLPILDGGQILFYTIEAIIGRQIPTKVREYIHIGCWILFLVLITLLSAKDLKNLLAPYIAHILKLF